MFGFIVTFAWSSKTLDEEWLQEEERPPKQQTLGIIMFAVLWDNFGDVNGRFFPILHSWKQFQFLGVLKKTREWERKEGEPRFYYPFGM